MVKDFCPNFLQPFLENIDRMSCNDGSQELIPIFHNPHRKCRPSPSTVARTLEYLVGAKISFLENINRGTLNDGSRKLNPGHDNPHISTFTSEMALASVFILSALVFLDFTLS